MLVCALVATRPPPPRTVKPRSGSPRTDEAVHGAHGGAHGAAEHARVAGAGPRVARQHAERARLAGAVDAQQPEALALAHGCGPEAHALSHTFF